MSVSRFHFGVSQLAGVFRGQAFGSKLPDSKIVLLWSRQLAGVFWGRAFGSKLPDSKIVLLWS
ncbi:MAG: hypothetical protein DPW18_08110 [Chloroflexi bacterium]|nr:hypothetical protein [Chloroflexota bacterium]